MNTIVKREFNDHMLSGWEVIQAVKQKPKKESWIKMKLKALISKVLSYF